jgi:hypothetical protein
MAGLCEHENGPAGSIKCRELLNYLRNYALFKKDSSPWRF